MFNKGDFVVYGRLGVCKIDDIGPSPFGGDDRPHYLLRPIDAQTSEIYTPVESCKVSLRPIMTKAEAQTAIDGFSSVGVLTVENEKRRRDVYKLSAQDNTPSGLFAIIKTVRVRREQLTLLRRHLTEADAEYESYAKKTLYNELSMALNENISNIEARINALIGICPDM